EELAKNDDEDTESDRGGDEVSESEGESDEEETRQEEEESFNPIPRTPEGSEDEGNDEEDQDLSLSEEARIQEEEEADELYRDSSSVSSFVTSMLNPISDAGVESIFTKASFPIVSLQTPTPIMTPSTTATITTSSVAPIPPTTIPSIILENLPTFNSVFRFDERLRSLETTFSEYRQTNLFVDAVSAIPDIVHQYMTQQMTEAIREAVQIQTDRLQDSLQRENDEFLCNIDENMKKIIKGQVKSQVKEQVSRILPRIKESMNATLEAEVLTRSSYSSRTSYAIVADLSKMELKKILNEKIEGNKSIQRSDEQQNLYKALVEAYDADKTILDTYGESTILKRRREDDDQEGPSAGSDRGSKRQREGGEHASASTPSETPNGSAGRSTTGSQSRQLSASESAFAEEPVQTTCQMEEPSHLVFETGAEDQSSVQTSQHPEWFSQPRRPPSPDRDWNKTLPAAQEDAQSWISVLARNSVLDMEAFKEMLHIRPRIPSQSFVELPFEEEILDFLRNSKAYKEYYAYATGEAAPKPKASVRKKKGGSASSTPPLTPIATPTPTTTDVAAPRLSAATKGKQPARATTPTEPIDVERTEAEQLKIVLKRSRQETHISQQCGFGTDEGTGSRPGVPDVPSDDSEEELSWNSSDDEDLSNLTVEEHFAFNVSLRMFTKSIVIQRQVEDLQLRVESYQKRLHLTKPDTYRPDLKRREAYTAYSNPRGFIYQNKDKKNILMRIDELYKFSDETLNDVRNALDDRLKGIRMQYLPTTIWRRGDKDRVAAMIQPIEKMLKTRRIMRNLEKFVGGRLYARDFLMLQRTI
nr:hypothetical protein [Tanacetum cinerariifolium]